jgi:hypothetical protein
VTRDFSPIKIFKFHLDEKNKVVSGGGGRGHPGFERAC